MMRAMFVAAFAAALLLACRDTPTSPTGGRSDSDFADGRLQQLRRRPTLPTGIAKSRLRRRDCSNFAGVYDVSGEWSCGTQHQPWGDQWTMVQSGCNVRVPLPADAGAIYGSARGNILHLTLRNGFILCQIRLECDASFDGRVLQGTLSGPDSCCSDGTATLRFIAVRR